MGKEKIRNTLNIFIKRVKNKYNPDKIILFGSYARGEAKEDSDVDILVVSDKFKNIKPFERSLELHRLVTDLNPDVNAFGFTPDEVNKSAHTPTLRYALRYGTPLL